MIPSGCSVGISRFLRSKKHADLRNPDFLISHLREFVSGKRIESAYIKDRPFLSVVRIPELSKNYVFPTVYSIVHEVVVPVHSFHILLPSLSIVKLQDLDCSGDEIRLFESIERSSSITERSLIGSAVKIFYLTTKSSEVVVSPAEHTISKRRCGIIVSFLRVFNLVSCSYDVTNFKSSINESMFFFCSYSGTYKFCDVVIRNIYTECTYEICNI